MKPRHSNQSNQLTRGFNLFETLILVAAVLLLAALFVSRMPRNHRTAGGINCVSNLKQVALCFRIWQGDNNDLYPMAISVTNGGAMESIATGDVAACFLTLTNELSTPRILACPADPAHAPARDFGPGFSRANISYFVNVDVTNDVPFQMILIGDDDLVAGSLPLVPGVSALSTNVVCSWSGARHTYGGNLGFADGSVREISDSQLQSTFVEAQVATNRLAIP